MSKIKRFLLYNMLVFSSSIALTGCAFSSADVVSNPKRITEYMQTPQKNDIYVMDCASFASYKAIKKSPYCVLLVTNITPQQITFTMADRVYASARNARNALSNSSLRDVNLNWDVTDVYASGRVALAKMHEEEKIVMIRRLTKQEVWNGVDSIARRPL